MEPVTALAQLLSGRRLFVLVGAGCSTESGIPDYRSSGITRPPLEHRAFVADPAVRRRYWSRSFAGWPRIARAQPNPAHRALAALERAGLAHGPVTQNVDGLHHAAGSLDVIELHGALREVVCLDCGAREGRDAVQDRIAALNPALRPSDGEVAPSRPDGDAAVVGTLSGDDASFAVPGCLRCGGVLKPAVVMFGDNVPKPLVEAAYARLDASDAVLVVGSSLTVFSGYRFAKRGAERGLPVAIVNRGPTRADPLAARTVDGMAGTVLPALAAALGAPGASADDP